MLERLRAGREGATEDEMVGRHHQFNGHEFEQTHGDGEGQGSLVCCRPWGCKVGHDLMTKQQQQSIKQGLLWWSSGEETAPQCRGRRFDSWSGNQDSTFHGATKSSPGNRRACMMQQRSCVPQLRPDTARKYKY